MGKLIKKKNKIKHIEPAKPVGRWCIEYDNRLPYPIECQFNRSMPHRHPNCIGCKRYVNFRKWKAGEYAKIEDDIDRGVDFSKKKKILKKKKRKLKKKYRKIHN